MKIYRIMIFVMLFNLVLTMLVGLNVFAWGTTGTSVELFGADWNALALTMIGVGLVTGVFGLTSQAAANAIWGVFFSLGGIGLTVQTMSWLALPSPITIVVGGVVGFIGFVALAQILSGSVIE